MSRTPAPGSNYSKKILKILSENKAVSVPELVLNVAKNGSGMDQNGLPVKPVQAYAVTRALRNLREAGLVESLSSDQNDYARLTRAGKQKANHLKLKNDTALLNPNWDGMWRIILLDLPESRKNERESLRYLLKKAGFVCLKNSAWISPYPFEHLFMNIKKDLGLTTELTILTTNTIDEETEKVLFEMFGK